MGVKLGRWGLDKYGAKPVKVDALTFYRYKEVLATWTACDSYAPPHTPHPHTPTPTLATGTA